MTFRVVATGVLIALGFFCMGYWRDDRVLSLMPLCFGWALFAQYNYVMVFLFGIAMVASYGLHLLEDSFSFAGIRWGYPFTASLMMISMGFALRITVVVMEKFTIYIILGEKDT